MRRDIAIVVSIVLILILILVLLSIVPIHHRLGEKPSSGGERVKEGELIDIYIPLRRFNSYDELINYITKYINTVNSILIPKGVFDNRIVVEPAPVSTQPPESSNVGSGTRYSRTNVQVEGIDELDIVKTNGYLLAVYSDYSNRVYVIDVSIDEVVSYISISAKYRVRGLFLTNEYLVVLAQTPEVRILPYVNPAINDYDAETLIEIYDITDPGNPVKVFSTTVSGLIVSSRLMNNTVYVVTQIPIYEPIIPCFNNTYIPINRIFIITDTPEYYVSIIAIDLGSFNYNVLSLITSSVNWMYMSYTRLYLGSVTRLFNAFIMYREICREILSFLPSEISVKVESYLSNGDVLSAVKTISNYFNQLDENNLESVLSKINEYLNQRNISEKTVFYVFDINGVYVNYTGSFIVNGIVLDQFSMEEFNNEYFVVATTSNQYVFKIYTYRSIQRIDRVIVDTNETIIPTMPEPYRDFFSEFYPFAILISSDNNVFVVNTSNLEIIGELRGLAENERIYSARLIKNILFLVTFRTVDPLFAIDLSNPRKPVILGYLKTPGFSEYLHPISPNLLIGIGSEDLYLKISLFNVTDPKNMSEISKILIPRAYSYVLHDHHAFTIDPDYSRFYIPLLIESWIPVEELFNLTKFYGILVVGYENNELRIIKLIDSPGATRVIYISEKLYVVSNMFIRIYSVKSLEFIKEIELTHELSRETITPLSTV